MLQTGQRLAERYTLGERIAVGGMGEVWRGMDDVLGRPIAIKALRQDLSADRAFQARFREEARTAGGLSHGGIAAVYDYGEQGTLSYLVMELVEGEPLSAMLARSGALDVDTTLDLIAQTARALHAAHLRGVVHRDVKPANLLVTPDLRVKVTDFGIARPRDHEPLTATGQVMGTAHYLAPELARGEVASPLSDVYALGIVAYECLAGRRPFEGDNQIAVATAQLMEQPPPLSPSLPVPVRRVVESALAKRPQDRPAGAHAFAVMLEDLHRARRAGGMAHAAAGSASPVTRPVTRPVTGAATVPGPGRLPRGELPGVAPAPAGVLGAGPAAPGSRRAAVEAQRQAEGRTPGRAQRNGGREPAGPSTAVLPVVDDPSGRPAWLRLGRQVGDRPGSAGGSGAASGGRPAGLLAGRGGWRRPSLPLLALSGLVVAAILGAALTGGDPASDSRTPGATLPSSTAPRSGTPTTTTAPSSPSSSTGGGSSGASDTVTIRRADYLGRPASAVRRELEKLGLEVRLNRVNRPNLPKGRVVDVEPSGRVVQGSTVTVDVADKRDGG